MVEHGAAQVGNHALADRHHQVETHEGRGREQRRDADHRAKRRVEQLRVGAAEAVVHDVLQPLAEREHAASGHHQGKQRQRDFQPVGRDKTRQAQCMPHGHALY